MVKETTDDSFQSDVLEASKPVLVDFWAEWCQPCKQLGPILEELGQSLGEKVDIYKINIDHNLDVPTQHGIRGVPTLILFKGGKPVSTKVGLLPKSQLQEWLESEVA